MKKIGIGILCAFAWLPSSWGGVNVVQKTTEYKMVVDPSTVSEAASLVLVWDAEDRGEKLADWPNSRVVSTTVSSAGGDFYTPIEGVPEGSVVRAFVKQTFKTIEDGGYVELSGRQYFLTDVNEHLVCGMEISFWMVGGTGAWCPLIAGTHDGFHVGRNSSNLNAVYVRCHDGEPIKQPAGITQGTRNTLSLRRDAEDAKTAVLTINGTEAARKTYNEEFVGHRTNQNIVRIGTSVTQGYFTNCKWYSVKFWDLNNELVREYVPAMSVESNKGYLYETQTGTYLASLGTGSCVWSGTPSATSYEKIIAVSPAATAVDPFYVVKAHWTGAAGNGLALDPANWACTNLLDEAVVGALPSTGAVVKVEGNINLQLAEGQVITGRMITVNATLAANTEWGGHFQSEAGTDALQAGSVLEMNGHGLTLGGGLVGGPNQWTVRNSAGGEPATLKVVTPAGTTSANKVTWIKGNVRMEKQGAGTYVVHRQNGSDGSDFTGGAYLMDGVTRLVDGTWWRVFGGDDKIVHIGANATLDIMGTYHICNTPIFLDGGTIRNTVKMTNQDTDGIGNVTLTADSSLVVQNVTVLTVGQYLYQNDKYRCLFKLQGHTLNVNIAAGQYLDLGSVEFTNGCVTVTGNGNFRVDGNARHYLMAPTADFDITAAQMEFYQGASFHDFTCRVTAAPGYADHTKDVKVYGTFRPVTVNFPRVVLQDGATLSLIDQTGTWSPRSASKNDGARTVFPEEGTITVDVTGRSDLLALAKSDNPYLVKWIADDVPVTTTFVMKGLPKGYSVRNNATGLFISSPTCVIIIR